MLGRDSGDEFDQDLCKNHSALGSVVPLAMFFFQGCGEGWSGGGHLDLLGRRVVSACCQIFQVLLRFSRLSRISDNVCYCRHRPKRLRILAVAQGALARQVRKE